MWSMVIERLFELESLQKSDIVPPCSYVPQAEDVGARVAKAVKEGVSRKERAFRSDGPSSVSRLFLRDKKGTCDF
jgi:hypothetical protein